MKKALIILLVLVSLSSFAYSKDSCDISFSIGQENYKWWNSGISFSYGMNIGLSPHMEINLWGISEAIPKPFASNMFGLDFTASLIGERNTGTKVAGSGINMLLSIGAFYKTEDNGAGPIISFTPLSVGNPMTGRRERLLKTGIGWDFVNNNLIVTFSLMNIEWYARGTYRDYF